MSEVTEETDPQNDEEKQAITPAETKKDEEIHEEPVQELAVEVPSVEKVKKLETIEEVAEEGVTGKVTEEIPSVEKDNEIKITTEEGEEVREEVLSGKMSDNTAQETEVASDSENKTSEVLETVTESKDVDNTNAEVQVTGDGGEVDVEEGSAKEDENIEQKEEEKEEELNTRTEAEKMLQEIDSSKLIVETDTQLEYRHEAESQDQFHITINEELPEIRGLAELEYEFSDYSMHKEDSLGDIEMIATTRRKSTKPSITARLLMEEEAENEKKRKPKKEPMREIEGEFEYEDGDSDYGLLNLSREEYYALYEKIVRELPYIRMKNKFLQRKIADSFKKRKLEHALKEEHDIQHDVIQAYEKKLDRLAKLFVVHKTKTTKFEKEISDLESEKEEKYAEKDSVFQQLISRERETGIGLINTKTGKQIPDKVVENLLRREISASKQIAELRLKFIAKRNEIAQITAELKALDNIGDLSLMDYEQLKIENRALSDKLEEREEELSKLREKCRSTVQIMAHIREKCAALDADMDVFKEEYEDVRLEYINIRERLNSYKTERDIIRNKTMKLKADSGLLTKPKLLQDMETSIQEMNLYGKTLEKFKRAYQEKTKKIRNLRKNIANEMMMSRKVPKEKKKKKTTIKFYKTRPTLIIPELPKDFLNKFA